MSATKTFTTLEVLLDRAHQEKLSSITTRMLLLPHENDQGIAVAHAEVVTSRGTFQAVGDASAESVGKDVFPHLIRVSETRAISRALRFATNMASTAEEETESSPAAIFDSRMREGLPSNGNGEKAISSRQVGMLLRLIRERGIKQEDFRTEVEQRFERPFDQISISEASELIQELMAA